VALLANGLYQLLLAGKITVDTACAQFGLPDEVLNGGLVEALARKASLGSLQHLLAPRRQRLGLNFRHVSPSQFLRQLVPWNGKAGPGSVPMPEPAMTDGLSAAFFIKNEYSFCKEIHALE
jgi:hypothetical protein